MRTIIITRSDSPTHLTNHQPTSVCVQGSDDRRQLELTLQREELESIGYNADDAWDDFFLRSLVDKFTIVKVRFQIVFSFVCFFLFFFGGMASEKARGMFFAVCST